MKKILFILIAISVFSCQKEKKKTLPILGNRYTEAVEIDGVEVEDTVYHTIPPFKLVSQLGDTIDNETFEEVIYIADFFFSTCPSICPIVKTNMMSIQEEFKGNNRIKIFSISLDPPHDTPEVLNEYAKRKGINANQWILATGDQEKILTLSREGFIAPAGLNKDAPGGIDHSGKILLVDTKGRIRSFHDGLYPDEIEKMIADIYTLMEEEWPVK